MILHYSNVEKPYGYKKSNSLSAIQAYSDQMETQKAWVVRRPICMYDIFMSAKYNFRS